MHTYVELYSVFVLFVPKVILAIWGVGILTYFVWLVLILQLLAYTGFNHIWVQAEHQPFTESLACIRFSK